MLFILIILIFIIYYTNSYLAQKQQNIKFQKNQKIPEKYDKNKEKRCFCITIVHFCCFFCKNILYFIYD